jgi:hypothetical protein
MRVSADTILAAYNRSDMANSAGKLVYTVESYVKEPETDAQLYARLDGEADLLRMRYQVLETLLDETHEELVKRTTRLNRLAEKHPELVDWD